MIASSHSKGRIFGSCRQKRGLQTRQKQSRQLLTKDQRRFGLCGRLLLSLDEPSYDVGSRQVDLRLVGIEEICG